MPEGHTTHRLARDIGKDLGTGNSGTGNSRTGKAGTEKAAVTRLVASSPQGKAAELAKAVDGSVLTLAEAYGKHLALHCIQPASKNSSTSSTNGSTSSTSRYDEPAIIHVHLGLIGKFTRVPADTPERDTIRLRLGAHYPASSSAANSASGSPTSASTTSTSGTVETVWDLTGPNTCELINEGEWDQITARLGPDPLRSRTSPNSKSRAQFCENLAKRKMPLAAALLDQSIVAGIGNVYRSELAFLSGVDPRQDASSLAPSQAHTLWEATMSQLRRGVRLNRIVSITDEDAEAIAGTTPGRLARSESLYVYKRQSEPCRRCGTPIDSAELAGRRIWWCPSCQS